MPSADLVACQKLIREGSKSFHAASLLLPVRVRWPAYALYGFCRIADDEVDEATSGKHARVEGLRRRLDELYRGRPRNHPVDRAMTDVIERFELPREILDGLLEGFAWDADGRRYHTLDELLDYCIRVASTVGVLMTLLMGPRDTTTLARASDLGAAMQLTNIARDVGEDARNGRLYLPLSWLDDAGIDPGALLARPVFSPALGGVVHRLLDEAHHLYERADAGVPRLPADCRWSIAAARNIYASIGDEVAAAGFDSVSRRAVVTKARKLALVAASLPSMLSTNHRFEDFPALPQAQFLLDAVSS
ncbi:MAG: phytoene/squalene synthase family protein [Polyangiaceae bacterium]